MSKSPRPFRMTASAISRVTIASGTAVIFFGFFAHGVVTDCSRTVRLRNIAQLEAVPALRAARDDSFYTSGCEETSRNMAQHLYFLAFDGCFHDLFREQVFRQPFYGRYDVIVPHTVSF
ncbi:hypothetical protein [Bacteroides xylanisolvens]|uniref:hypothetical protein n=1 Tax=Bacteroides xylanisolvens TaxID=371601 RepID=UPI0022E09628|nr:hypothetical protein [Bacteroides xylanisolvens]